MESLGEGALALRPGPPQEPSQLVALLLGGERQGTVEKPIEIHLEAADRALDFAQKLVVACHLPAAYRISRCRSRSAIRGHR